MQGRNVADLLIASLPMDCVLAYGSGRLQGTWRTCIFLLMPEMPLSCKDHGNSIAIGHANSLLVADRTARLNYGRDARLRRSFHAIREREERIGGQHRAA